MRDVNKKSVMVYLDPEVVKEARELGLNISRICENALREAIRRLKGEDCQNNNHREIVGPRGFEPRTTSAPGLCPDDGILVQAGRLGLIRPHEDGPRDILANLLKNFRFLRSYLVIN